MSVRRLIVVVASLAGVIALGAYAYYANRSPGVVQGEVAKGGPPEPGTAGKETGGIAVTVETAPVATTRLQEDVVAIGTLRSNESVVVRPEISGRITEIGFAEGSPVQKGQLLVALDASVYAAELQQDGNLGRLTVNRQ